MSANLQPVIDVVGKAKVTMAAAAATMAQLKSGIDASLANGATADQLKPLLDMVPDVEATRASLQAQVDALAPPPQAQPTT